MLRAQVFQRLLWIPGLNIVATNYESVLGRDPKFEDVPITDHVESPVANNRHQTNHPQHRRLAYQNISTDLLIIGYFPLLESSD